MAEKETENTEVLSSQFFHLAFSVLATHHSLHCAINTTGNTMLLKPFKVLLIYGWPQLDLQLSASFLEDLHLRSELYLQKTHRF